jgi:hypothetical protein
VSSVLFPIYLSYEHQSLLTERLTAITSVRKLKDLLALPEGYEGFLAFARREFASEGVVCLCSSLCLRWLLLTGWCDWWES